MKLMRVNYLIYTSLRSEENMRQSFINDTSAIRFWREKREMLKMIENTVLAKFRSRFKDETGKSKYSLSKLKQNKKSKFSPKL